MLRDHLGAETFGRLQSRRMEARQATAEFVLSHSRQPFQGTPSIMIFNPSGILVAFQAGPVPVDSIEEFIAQRSN